MSNENVKLKGRLSGHLTLSGTKKTMNQEVKEAIVERDDGKVCKLRKVLIDPETKEEVVFEGPVRISKNGNLTAFVNVVLNDIGSVLVDAPAEEPEKKAEKPKFDADAAAKKLLGASA